MLLIPGIFHRFYVKLFLENHVLVDLRCQIIQEAKEQNKLFYLKKMLINKLLPGKQTSDRCVS